MSQGANAFVERPREFRHSAQPGFRQHLRKSSKRAPQKSNKRLMTDQAAAVTAALLVALSASTFAQGRAAGPPDDLEGQLAVLRTTYPKTDGSRRPKAPADSAWVFRSPLSSIGTVEVGFEGSEVVYMIFRRGLGGRSWGNQEIHALHVNYHQELLKETYNPITQYFSRYNHSVASRISAAVITRKDFDPSVLLGGI